jgi:hypothetical protein
MRTLLETLQGSVQNVVTRIRKIEGLGPSNV